MSEPSTSTQIFSRLNLSQRILLKWVDREMTELVGATTTQIAAIFYLMENDGCQMVDLSRELLQNKSAISTLVERMVKNEFITRTPSRTDGRASQLYLTEKGRQVGNRALPYAMEYDKELVKDFTVEEIRVINRFLDSIIQRFEITPDNYFKKQFSNKIR
jgi:DNA-binding MarR family transcriptional regulator